MKLLFDFFPILIFFISYKIFDIYTATALTMLASVIQVLIQRVKYQNFEQIHLISLGLILILGTATLLLHNPWFIKLKPTCIYWAFALVFTGSAFIGKKNITQKMMEGNINLPFVIWKRLNWAWATFFILMGAINLYVAFFFATNTWVNFKLFGGVGFTLLFIILQSLYLAKHLGISGNNDFVQKQLNMDKSSKE